MTLDLSSLKRRWSLLRDSLPAWAKWLSLLLFSLPVALPMLVQAWAWQCATDWAAFRWLLYFVGVVAALGLVIGFTAFGAWTEAAQHESTSNRRRIALLAAFLACGSLGQGIAINLASSRIEDFTKSALPEAGALYTNHDKNNLVSRPRNDLEGQGDRDL